MLGSGGMWGGFGDPVGTPRARAGAAAVCPGWECVWVCCVVNNTMKHKFRFKNIH